MVTDSLLDELRQRHDAARPDLLLLKEHVQTTIATNIRQRGVVAAKVEGRVKDTSGLVKKALRKSYADPWNDIRDKVGVRITTVFPEDQGTVANLIREVFDVRHYEDKREALEPSKFDYLGLHFEVDLHESDAPELRQRSCEIQVRTSVQTAWADVSHDLLYKAPLTVSPTTRRSVHRLMALVELFDLEVTRIQGEIMAEPDFSVGQVTATLEHGFLSLTGHNFDPQLSRFVVDKLLPIVPATQLSDYTHTLEQFIEQHKDKLAAIYRDYLTDGRHLLVSQPESLMVFERIESDRFSLQNGWPDALPITFLTLMATIWGSPIDSDDDA